MCNSELINYILQVQIIKYLLYKRRKTFSVKSEAKTRKKVNFKIINNLLFII